MKNKGLMLKVKSCKNFLSPEKGQILAVLEICHSGFGVIKGFDNAFCLKIGGATVAFRLIWEKLSNKGPYISHIYSQAPLILLSPNLV